MNILIDLDLIALNSYGFFHIIKWEASNLTNVSGSFHANNFNNPI